MQMKSLVLYVFALLAIIALWGCGIPDLPGPIGIPGL